MNKMSEVKAAVLHGIRDIRTETRTVPPPGPDELQIAVRSTGICGSDQHYYNHFRNGDILVREPLALGHESSGVVTAVGSSLSSSWKEGDRVALEVGVPCDECDLCKAGRYNICAKMSFRSSAKSFPHFQGTLQGVINHPAKWCHKLPDSVSLDEAALLEPLSVAMHAVRRASLTRLGASFSDSSSEIKAKKGVRALVIGAGAVGLLTAAMLRVEKARSITLADIEGKRVEFGLANGFADVGVTVPRTRAKSDSVEDKLSHAQETSKLLQGLGQGQVGESGELYDVVFECTGVESCIQAAIYSTAPGGTVMMVGMGTPVGTLPLSSAFLREVDLRGVFRYANTYQPGLKILEDRKRSGLPDVSLLATHHFKGIESVVDAFAMAAKPIDDQGKLVIKVIIET
ncbi:GroES-like protein [Xylariaceae sp. FL0255]|nr:GroES-like protein [Xylariaceae sp. FL0255]